MNSVAKHLMSHGIRPSIQRIAIMQYLMGHATHPTVDTIYKDLHDDIPTLSRTTVYNTLALLEEKNAMMSITIDSHNVRYDGNANPHAHFQCRKCGMIFDSELNVTDLQNIKYPKGFDAQQVQVFYYGTCGKCREKEAMEKGKQIN
ncbi:MAG: transcriptional repressor [Muribaculaceae bacterium]|jgi:Fur family peroxide stress response transcriptional regulator|nr:transcriptional repressor [Muribaculaceae bacterium]